MKQLYGGWMIREEYKKMSRLVRLVTRCQSPDMVIYLDNFKARRAAR